MLSKKINMIEKSWLWLYEKVELILIGENKKPATLFVVSANEYDSQKGYYAFNKKDIKKSENLKNY